MSARGSWLVWAGYEGPNLGELLSALRCVEASGYFAAAVDNCGVVSVPKEAADLLERELGVLA